MSFIFSFIENLLNTQRLKPRVTFYFHGFPYIVVLFTTCCCNNPSGIYWPLVQGCCCLLLFHLLFDTTKLSLYTVCACVWVNSIKTKVNFENTFGWKLRCGHWYGKSFKIVCVFCGCRITLAHILKFYLFTFLSKPNYDKCNYVHILYLMIIILTYTVAKLLLVMFLWH